MSSIKSSMQMLNLGLSIFNKMQTIQHRQIRMARDLRSKELPRHKQETSESISDAEILSSKDFKSI